MSAVQEKKFVMKHVFHDIMSMEGFKEYYGQQEVHFNVPWAISITRYDEAFSLGLECLYPHEPHDWSIETNIVLRTNDEDCPLEEYDVVKSVYNVGAYEGDELRSLKFSEVQEYLVDGNLTVVCYVKITKMTGIVWKKLSSFDEPTVLIVENEKFCVGKRYLASHSTYFKSLFMGNFDESKQSDITLNNIDPFYFQKFLEVLHREPAIDEDTILGILKLADMYDSKTAMRQCEKFLIESSKQSLKDKFNIAIKYEMDELRNKCIAEIKTKDDIISVMPQYAKEMKPSTWEELLKKAISLM